MAQESKSQAVTDYLVTLPEGRWERGEAIHLLVKKLYPKATYDFSYRMPTYHVGEQFS